MQFETLKKKRLDYFLIWGHGVKYLDEIVSIIHNDVQLEIVHILEHHILDVPSFIERVYSHDYAPFEHLKEKTEYLLDTPRQVYFVFVNNLDVLEVFRGDGAFRHVECDRIKRVKDVVRDKFNPREGEVRTENHVIHASDNEAQTANILRFLGYSRGSKHFEYSPNTNLNVPYHLPSFRSFLIKRVPLEKIKCNIVASADGSEKKTLMAVQDTPHYQFLLGKTETYENYLNSNRGKLMTDNHSAMKLKFLAQDFAYLSRGNETSYILVSPLDENEYVVLDGVHRLAALALRGQKAATVAVVE